jgi:hypothetical protein
MKSTTYQRRPGHLLVAACLPLALLALATADAGDGDSPEAVFKAAQAASAKQDIAGMVRLTAPSERPMVALSSDMGVGMFVEFWEGEDSEAVKKRYADIQQKYGVDLEAEDEGEKFQIGPQTTEEEVDAHMRRRADKLYGKIDTVGYISEIMAIVLEMPEMAGRAMFPEGELGELKVEGDRATGTADGKEVRFMREDGHWYLTADAMD